MPKKNDAVTLRVTAVSNLGYGVGRTEEGLVVFVPGTVTGEMVEARVIKVTKSYCVGKLEKILESSPLREPCARCSAPATCGGCAYRFVTYGHELETKRRNVEEEFEKAGLSGANVLPVLCVRDSAGEPVIYGYRNKAQYRFVQTKNGVRAGFYASGTHRVTGDESCPLQPALFGDIARRVCRFADDEKLSVYDETSGRGLLRHLYLRGASGSGDVGVCLVINGGTLPGAEKLYGILKGEFPRVSGLVLNINRLSSNVILGDRFVTVGGKESITDVFCGLDFEISPAAFYQVNHDAAELLCRTAAGLADLRDGETLLDLYCGIGTVGLSLIALAGRRDVRLTGIEIVREAVECARRNAAANGVKGAEFICADSADGADALLDRAGYVPDAVVLDPPRKGCSEDLLRSLTDRGVRRIVYISCNPATLARDCAILRSLGWSMSDAQPVDLFPRTGHVETVVLMSRDKE